jgi:hypothetical protein
MSSGTLGQHAADAALALCHEAAGRLSEFQDNLGLLYLLHEAPEQMWIALPTWRATKILVMGNRPQVAAEALQELAQAFYLRCALPADMVDAYVSAPERAAQMLRLPMAALTAEEANRFADAMRLVHAAHWATLMAVDGTFIAGFGHRGVVREPAVHVADAESLRELVRGGPQPRPC